MGRPRSASESVVISSLKAAEKASRPRSVSICEEKPFEDDMEFSSEDRAFGRPRSDSICSETGRRKRKPAAPIKSVSRRYSVTSEGDDCDNKDQGEERPRKCSLIERAEKLHLKSEPADEDLEVNIMDDDDETVSLESFRENKRVRVPAEVDSPPAQPNNSPTTKEEEKEDEIDMFGVSILAALSAMRTPAEDKKSKKPTAIADAKKPLKNNAKAAFEKRKAAKGGVVKGGNQRSKPLLKKPETPETKPAATKGAAIKKGNGAAVPVSAQPPAIAAPVKWEKTAKDAPAEAGALADGEGKDFLCTWQGCSRTFGHKSHLTRHVRTVHEGRKDHVCTYGGCRKSFRDKRDYVKHVWIVHEGRKDFQCQHTECRRTFGDKRDYARHMRTAHPNTPLVGPEVKVNKAPTTTKMANSPTNGSTAPSVAPPSQALYTGVLPSSMYKGTSPHQAAASVPCTGGPNCPGCVPPPSVGMRYACGCLVSNPDPRCTGTPTTMAMVQRSGPNGPVMIPPPYTGGMPVGRMASPLPCTVPMMSCPPPQPMNSQVYMRYIGPSVQASPAGSRSPSRSPTCTPTSPQSEPEPIELEKGYVMDTSDDKALPANLSPAKGCIPQSTAIPATPTTTVVASPHAPSAVAV